jgi:hypothetical protein
MKLSTGAFTDSPKSWSQVSKPDLKLRVKNHIHLLPLAFPRLAIMQADRWLKLTVK